MLFNSFEFMIFLPVVLLVYYCIAKKYRCIWLLFASYIFYMNWNIKYVALLFCCTVFTYSAGLFLEQMKKQGWMTAQRNCVILCVAGNLSILAFFKYTNFFLDNINHMLQVDFPHANILLPVGISFYMFQSLSYVIDVYRGTVEVERNFLRYALFVSFFPQLVAGPIERSKNLLAQIKEERVFDFDKARDGIFLLLWGFFLKIVIADRIAIFVDTVYGDIITFSGWYLILATVLFAIQIYCDFAGYSTIAMGTAKLLGFQLMDNFDAPYLSSSVSEFWKRWHISLTSWFRDYLYIPLGGNRKGVPRKCINTMIVFLLSGLWHGASWTYVVWGGLNGAYQIIEASMKQKSKRTDSSTLRKIIKVIITFVLVDITWVFFRAETIQQALEIIKSMVTANNAHILMGSALFEAGLGKADFIVLAVSLLILLISDFTKYRNISMRSHIQKKGYFIRTAVITVAVVGIYVFGIWGAGYDAAEFIYFQF